ncbi:F-box only protein 36a [Hypomesus transpacificus]|uniref:F-box only protein 36a n=1 Tax=Hypomesus transpacificus TaxID=137520 RepID=UPI001F07888A|nr:F-box only protein 36a [Hypomesus transpacificus]
MASLLGEQVFEISGVGPSPSKDFFQIVITKTDVIWRSWKISLRVEFRSSGPGEMKQSHEEYLLDSRLQHQVGLVFGQKILQYTLALCKGHFDYIQLLPSHLLLRIVSYLNLKDTGQLAQTTEKFRKLCNSPEFWEQIVRHRCDDFTADMEGLAKAMGWRNMYLNFFHKKKDQEAVDNQQGGSETPSA